MQRAIPAGALRPVYDIPARTLLVAGEVVVRFAAQARIQAAVLTAFELAGWKTRVCEPLRSRPGNGTGRIAVAAHKLNQRQALVEFHADDGAAKWNWRVPEASLAAGARGR